MMVQNSVRSVQHAISFLTDLQAKIDIIESDGKFLFVEPTHFLKYLSSSHQASSSDGADISDDIRQIEVVLVVPIEPLEGMATVFKKSHHYPSMLDFAVWIEELCAHSAHLGTPGQFDHRGEPVTRDHGGVVVQEEQ